MSNYYSTTRTNYFKVKDSEAFTKELEGVDGIEALNEGNEFVLLATGDAGFPSVRYVQTEEGEVDVDFDVIDLVSKHLADEQVAIFMEAGSEKLRYIHGHAIAVNNKGETRQIYLSDIYKLAEQLGSEITPVEY